MISRKSILARVAISGSIADLSTGEKELLGELEPALFTLRQLDRLAQKLEELIETETSASVAGTLIKIYKEQQAIYESLDSSTKEEIKLDEFRMFA